MTDDKWGKIAHDPFISYVTIYADPQHEEKYSSDLLNTFLYASKYKENLFDQEIVPSYKFMI
jgi:hypothetical protein